MNVKFNLVGSVWWIREELSQVSSLGLMKIATQMFFLSLLQSLRQQKDIFLVHLVVEKVVDSGQ